MFLARFLFKKSIPGIIELQEFAFNSISSTSSSRNKKENIKIEIFYSRLPKWLQHVLDSFIYLLSSVVFAIITWQTFLQVDKN